MMRRVTFFLCVVGQTGVSACANLPTPFARGEGATGATAAAPIETRIAAEDARRPIPRPSAGTAASDISVAEDEVGVPRQGGETIASLGDPTDPGLWLDTPLVSREQPGQITAASGATLTVTLRPIPGDPGAGSRISLAAMQALGLPLTALAPITVEVAG